MPRVLKDITINEVSSVDRGAGRGVKVMLMKRDDSAEPYWKRDFTQEQRDQAASSGAAMSDGSFPVKSEQDLKNAIQAVGRASDPEAAKAHIQARAKTLGLTNLIPDTWKRDSGDVAMTQDELNKIISDSVTAGIAKALEGPTALLAKQSDEIVLLKMTDAHKAYMATCNADTQKSFRAMSPDERDAYMQKNPLKKAEAPVEQAELAKRDAQIADLLKSQKDMASELAATRLEKAQASFKKQAVDAGLTEADGETMRKAYGGDAEAQVALTKRFTEATAALKKQVDTGKLFGEFGTKKGAQGDAYAAIEAKADELRKADSKLTKEQAFAKVYEDPANRELVQQHKTEEMRKRPTVVAA